MNPIQTLLDALWLSSMKRMNAAKAQWDKLPKDLQKKAIQFCTYLNQTTEDLDLGAKVYLDTNYGTLELSEYNLLSIKNNLPAILGI